MKKEFNYAIALTGGIATGKSTTANLFMMYGFLIIDADKIAHKLLDKYSLDIANMFGSKFVENGKVLRSKLGEVIFSDKSAKKRLEEFLHPLIKKQIIEEAKVFEEAKKPYLIDIPLFFENKNYDIDKSIVVYCDEATQLQRLIDRDGFDKNIALARINSQLDIEEKKQLATYIIDNTKDLKHLQNEVEKIVKELI